jgi:hypothetical protein
MVRILTKLKINEVSSVDRGAGEGVKIVLMKRDDTPQRPLLFNDIMLAKVAADDEQRTNTIPDDDKVSAKLRSMVDAMIVAVPTLDRQTATHYLLHTPKGRRLAEHFNSISKRKDETPMPTVDIMKLHNPDSVIEFIKSSGASEFVISEVIMGHARLNKRDGESDAQAFARVFPKFQTAYGVSKGYPNMMSVEPVSVEVGDTTVEDDSWKAAAQLTALVEEQRARARWMTASKLYERVYADPANKAVVARAHKRPTASSVNTDYLER